MIHPSFETILKNPHKSELYTFQRSWKSLIPGLFFFFLSIVILFWIQLSLDVDEISRLTGVIPFAILLETLRRYYNDLYILGDDTVKRKHGRLSLKYAVPTVKYVDIRGMMVSQTFWGRILGYGNIEIGTAAQDGAELTIETVDAPHQLSNIIESFKTLNLKSMSPLAKKHLND